MALTFTVKKAAIDFMNARFLYADAACGAPQVDVTGVLSALAALRAQADRLLRLRRFTADEVYRIAMSQKHRKTYMKSR